MSFDPLMKALKDNPALLDELKAAKTPRERHAVLDAHGIEKPDLDSQYPWGGAGQGANVGGGCMTVFGIPISVDALACM